MLNESANMFTHLPSNFVFTPPEGEQQPVTFQKYGRNNDLKTIAESKTQLQDDSSRQQQNTQSDSQDERAENTQSEE